MVALGGNDMLRGLEPSESMENLKNILSKLQAAGKPTLLAGMLAPSNMGARYTQELSYISGIKMILMLSSIHFF